ncbi:hypothetical protein [Micromonospora wenchangensis]|uniref:hypothetical protein n=1 Tax=Micromonospora wenchangensis TaxID=1185415 RepID=UPI003D75A02F
MEASFLLVEDFDDIKECQAIKRSLSAHSNGAGLSFLVGERVSVGEVNAYFVLAVSSDALNAVPRGAETCLSGEGLSIVSLVLQEVISRFRLAFRRDFSAVDFSLTHQVDEIVRASAERLLVGVLGLAFNVGVLLDQMSTLPYEGRAGIGGIRVEPKLECGEVADALILERAIHLKDVKAVRKLLEVSGEVAELLMWDGRIYGVRISVQRLEPAPGVRGVIRFRGRGAWDLYDRCTLLLSSRDGFRRLPAGRALDEIELARKVEWLIPDADVQIVQSLARAASAHRHGAMLIVSADAESESERLYPQAWRVSPTRLSDELLTQLTAMDGGIMVDGHGNCHAFGIILDGRAGDDELSTRGSRFNNAVRYLATPEEGSGRLPRAVVLVFSADGGVDILPKMPPAARRLYVSQVVGNLMDAIDNPTVGIEDLRQRLELVERVSFYLSEGQCDDVNRVWRQLYGDSSSGARVVSKMRIFRPDPRMDEARFFLD